MSVWLTSSSPDWPLTTNCGKPERSPRPHVPGRCLRSYWVPEISFYRLARKPRANLLSCKCKESRSGKRSSLNGVSQWIPPQGLNHSKTQHNIEVLPPVSTKTLTITAGCVVGCCKKEITNFQPVDVLQRTLRDRVYLCCRCWPPVLTVRARRGKDKGGEWEGTRLQIQSLSYKIKLSITNNSRHIFRRDSTVQRGSPRRIILGAIAATGQICSCWVAAPAGQAGSQGR